jgi:predicted DNA binding CopG/RHH family protein
MSKKDDLANDLSRGRKHNIKKSINTTEEKAKEVVEKVVPVKKEAAVEKLIRTTMDLPKSVHRAIKMKSAADGISLKDYIVSLVKKDLNLN